MDEVLGRMGLQLKAMKGGGGTAAMAAWKTPPFTNGTLILKM
jgi:hypothetical protein